MAAPARSPLLLALVLAASCAGRRMPRDGGARPDEPAQQPADAARAAPAPVAEMVPRGATLIPGDLASRVRCGFAACPDTAPSCFDDRRPAAAGGAGPAGPRDTCFEYRLCLRSCELAFTSDPVRRALCGRGECDPVYPQGLLQFRAFRHCLLDHCLSFDVAEGGR